MNTGSRTRCLLCAVLSLGLLLPLFAGCGPNSGSEAKDQEKVEKLKQDKLKSDK